MAPGVIAGQMGRHRSKESSTTGTFCLPGISCLYRRPHSDSSSHCHHKLSIDPAISSWKELASTFNNTTPPPISTGKQQNWDDLICKLESESLLNETTDPVMSEPDYWRLWLIQPKPPIIWLWRLARSAANCINRSETRRFISPDRSFELGTPFVHPHQCCCGTIMPSDATKLGWPHLQIGIGKSAGRQSRHSQINDIIHRAFICAGNSRTSWSV